MSAVGRVMRVSVRRRRVQTLVIGLATLMAVTASVLGGGLIVVSDGPFDAAFASQNGAHLSATYDPALATTDAVAATGKAAGVTKTSGPYPVVSVTPSINGHKGMPITLAGRDSPDAAVDSLTLTSGRWATAPGEIVLASGDGNGPSPIGEKFTFPNRPGSPVLTVVGTAMSASRTADGWVTAAQATALTTSGTPDGYQMLYRLGDADTAAAIDNARTTVSASLPAEAMLGSQSWLDVKKAADQETVLYIPFLLAFGILGLVMSVLIVGNVVAGAVGAGVHRIGILKAVGFTPGQVVRVHIGQALIPAIVGTLLGVLGGHLMAVPVLAETRVAYSSPNLTIPVWVDVVVAVGVLALVTMVAWAAALRAGRLRTVDALAVGRTPRAGRGQLAARLLSRLPLSRPITIGLARPFARPVRALAMIAAIAFGATAVTFAVGLSASLNVVLESTRHNVAQVTVIANDPDLDSEGEQGGEGMEGPHGPPPELPADVSAINAAINAQPGTKASYGVGRDQASIVGVGADVDVIAFSGDASWNGYTMTEGRWFEALGEAIVPSALLKATGKKIGDSVTLYLEGQRVTVRIVGEIFDTRNDGMEVFADAATFTKPLQTQSIKVAITSGTDLAAYTKALDTAIIPLGAMTGEQATGGDQLIILNALTAILTLMLVAVAGLGVLNGVLLDTRERVRDIGVHKAIGMTPRQTISSVLSSVVVNGLIGGAIGVFAGIAVHNAVVPAMGDTANVRLPPIVLEVFTTPGLTALAFGGLAIAVVSALLPAFWAARIRTTTALRTE